MLENLDTLKEISLGTLIVLALVYVIKLIIDAVKYIADSRTVLFSSLIDIIKQLSLKDK